MAKVDAYNIRCHSVDLRFQRKVWSKERALNHVLRVIVDDVDFKVEFYKTWNLKASQHDVEL